MPHPTALLDRAARRAIVGRVRAVFNDQARGERPVERSPEALFDPSSVIWRVHGDVTAMMVGGVSALLLQMLHPAALAGVWDHSAFRDDMLGRLRRTARFVATTTYGPREDAEAAIARVRAIHERVAGHTADGRAYRASDPRLLAWVHLAEALSFLRAHQRFGERRLSATESDRYMAETAEIADLLGADPVPRTVADAEKLIAEMRADLAADDRTMQIARTILRPPGQSFAAMPMQRMIALAAVDLLPAWARSMLRLEGSGLGRPLVDVSTGGVARTIRWAFRGV